MKFPYGYKSDIRSIKAAGFSHIKFEFEADLDRLSHEDFESESYCQRWLKSRLSVETLAALTYFKFYNDGSVDSEITATLPIEKAHLGLDIMRAFEALGDEVGHGLGTERAGMHIALLTSGTYPSHRLLNVRKLTNFNQQMTKLMPALFAAATHDGFTRCQEFRLPRVSNDRKYSAIFTHGGTCLEYRVFDTCYGSPDALLEKIQIIARTVQFYSEKKITIKSSRFCLNLPEDYDGGSIRDSLRSLPNLQAMNETIKFLKPKSVSLRAFKLARRMDVQVSELRAKQRELKKGLHFDYQAYKLEWRASELRRFGNWLRRQDTTLFDTKAWLALYQNENPGRRPDTLDQFVAAQSYETGTQLRLDQPEIVSYF